MLKKILLICIVIIIIIYITPLFLIIYNKDQKINKQVDYLIILGAKVNDDKPSLTLQYRLDGAIKYYKKHDVKIIVTGGQGDDEKYPESHVMKTYLIENGVDKNNIIIEDKSTNTFENLENSKQLFDYKNNDIGVITTDFHVFRASFLCKRVFNKQCEMQSSLNYIGVAGLYSLLREPFAVYKSFLFDK